MRKTNNDSMSPPRAMTLGAGGREPVHSARRPPTPPKHNTLLRLIHALCIIRDIALARTLNYNFPKHPLVKLKETLRTSVQFDFVKLVKTLVQLFIVAKCTVRDKAWVVLLLCCFCTCEGKRDDDLHIGGIFPMEGEGGWQGGQACMPAAELALTDVNARSDLLSGFKLLLHSNDSKV